MPCPDCDGNEEAAEVWLAAEYDRGYRDGARELAAVVRDYLAYPSIAGRRQRLEEALRQCR